MTANAPPLRPAQGIAVSPVAIATGSPQTIPFPTDPHGGPMPWRTPWLVLLNSSPFTLLVATGATTTQIAAFTSDKVYVYATGTGGPPVTVTAQGGSGTPGPGSDSTVYATWYEDEPPGTYPAALGSGAVADVFDSEIIHATAIPILSGGPGVSDGPFPTTGFGGVSVLASETSGNGPLTITCTWQTTPNSYIITQRTVVVPASGVANFTLPNFGPLFTIAFTNGTAANIAFSAVVSFLPDPSSSWTVLGIPSILIPVTATSVSSGVSTVNASSTYVYAGPAVWFLFYNNMTTGIATVQYQTGDANWHTLLEQRVGPATASNPVLEPPPVPILIPPNPIRILVNQSLGSPVTPLFSITADDFRISC